MNGGRPDVLVRAAVPDDADRLGAIHVAGWRWAYRGIMPDALLAGLSVEERAERRRRYIEAPDRDTRTFVIEEAGSGIAGFAITGRCRDDDRPGRAELFAIYLDPARAGTGLGLALMRHSAEDLARRGFADMSLWVLTDNVRARRFYERFGFVADGAEKSFDADGTPLAEVRYVRSLDPPAA